MIFNYINEIPAVNDFETLYGDQLCKDFPELSNLEIKIYTDQLGKGWIKVWDNQNDSPYTCNHIVNEIMRCDEVYNKCNFTKEEEYAILAHELGHIIDGKHNNNPIEDNLLKEMKADKIATSLGLASHLQTALQKMIHADIKPCNNIEMQQRINAL